jgi:L-ascorbate metabolism protein UlaG (beta-lactamase superfamily)
MYSFLFALSLLVMGFASMASAQPAFETDTFPTSAGDLQITFIGHGSLMLRQGSTVIHVDPVSQVADYAKLPKADVILVTHQHGDHLDAKAIEQIRTERTVLVGTAKCAAQVPGFTAMGNGDHRTVGDLRIEAVPAYNLVHKRPTGEPFHPKGEGNGYLVTFGKTRVYVAGDTENVPEVKALRGVDIAFLPMNLPFTMTPEMVADSAKAMSPKVLYPYHTGDTDLSKLAPLLAGTQIDLRLRKLK